MRKEIAMRKNSLSKKRTKRESLLSVNGEQYFSSWHKIMKPSPYCIVDLSFFTAHIPPESTDWIHRAPGHCGRRAKNLSTMIYIPEEPGIYELMIHHSYYNIFEVVYIGHSNRNLRERIDNYCRNGSHKADWLNRLLNAGFSISVRYRVVHSHDLSYCPISKSSDWNNYRTAQELETLYLKNYDYILNTADNLRTRMTRHRFYVRSSTRSISDKSEYTLKIIESRALQWAMFSPMIIVFVISMFNIPYIIFLFVVILCLLRATANVSSSYANKSKKK